MVFKRKTGIVLINTGSPVSPDPVSVRRYLAEFLMDPFVRPLPAILWAPILKGAILPRRSKASAEKYRSIWTDQGSPLVVYAQKLAAKTQCVLGDTAVVRVAMIYGEPGCRAALSELRAAACEDLVVIPLYPQSAFSTTRAACAAVRRALSDLAWSPQVYTVCQYGDDKAYLQALRDSVLQAGFRSDCDTLFVSFHSVPLSDVRAHDTYPHQVRATFEGLVDALHLDRTRAHMAYQSPFPDARTWLDPFTCDELPRIAAMCTQGDLYVICPGFSLDCLETLYDVEHEFKPCVSQFLPPESHMVYVPCLNETACHARLLAGIAEQACRQV